MGFRFPISVVTQPILVGKVPAGIPDLAFRECPDSFSIIYRTCVPGRLCKSLLRKTKHPQYQSGSLQRAELTALSLTILIWVVFSS